MVPEASHPSPKLEFHLDLVESITSQTFLLVLWPPPLGGTQKAYTRYVHTHSSSQGAFVSLRHGLLIPGKGPLLSLPCGQPLFLLSLLENV